MKTAKCLMLLGTLLAGTNSVLFAQPIELPSSTEKVPLPKIEIESRRPIWSPDGKEIAFLSNKDCEDKRQFNLYFINPPNTRLRKFPLSKDPKKGSWYEHCDFSWSPDGKKIVFVFSNIAGLSDSTTDIYTANSDGTNQRNLTQQNKWESYSFISWSPDGTKIAFTKYPEYDYAELRIIDANGKFVYKLAERGVQPVWSPDGGKIAFLKLTTEQVGRHDKTESTIFTIDIDGKNEQSYQIEYTRFSRIFWSPDGTRLFTEGINRIYEFDIESKSERIGVVVDVPPSQKVQGEINLNSTLSSDGKEIVFNKGGDIWKVTITSSQENSLFKNQPVEVNLTNTENIKEETPCWSPDGKKIAYVHDGEIWTMDDDGKNQKQLTFERTKVIEAAIKKQEEEIKARERTIKEVVEKK